MVIDASATLELLERTTLGAGVESAIADEASLAAPDLLVFEVVAALRRQAHRGELTGRKAADALEDLGGLPIDYFPTLELRHRAWALRHNFSAGDAMFAALAELFDEPLLTTDGPLAAAANEHLGIEVIVPPSGRS